jgi:pilus assembly protein CpaB
MRKRAIAIIGAVVLAVAAAALTMWYASSVRTEAVKQEDTQVVLVATDSIPARTMGDAVVSNNLVERQEVPLKLVAPGALTSEAQLKGKVLQASLSQGQQIVSSQLMAPEQESLAFRVKDGMRAVSVTIDRARAVAGLITPGDRVDVIATFEYEVLSEGNVTLGQLLPSEEIERIKIETGLDINSSKSSVTRTVLQQAEVLHIDPPDKLAAASRKPTEGEGDGETEAPDLPVAVLMVTPEEAEKLVFAEEIGVVSFALVPAEDREKVSTPGRMLGNEYGPVKDFPVEDQATPVAGSAQQ